LLLVGHQSTVKQNPTEIFFAKNGNSSVYVGEFLIPY
jgi:hypothetical protein